MPLNLPINKSKKRPQKNGELYVVAMPIGNQDDITVRALRILTHVDYVAAEDTRLTGRYLACHSIKSRLLSYFEHNEKKRIPELIEKIQNGASIALVSSAGTPSVSDPGYRLIKEAITCGIKVTPIPGVSAAIAALSVAGLPTDSFYFAGFPSKKKGKRREQLKRLAEQSSTIIFYESPKRILSLIDDMIVVMGDRYGILAREMTKKYEEFIRGDLSTIKRKLMGRSEIKGECTLLIKGYERPEEIPWEKIKIDLKANESKSNTSLSKRTQEIAKKYHVPKSVVYDFALKVKNDTES